MPTDTVLKKIIRDVVKEEVKDQFDNFEVKIDAKFEKMTDKLVETVTKIRDETITSNDKVANLLKTDHEEHDILNERSKKINKLEDDVEKLKSLHPHGQHIVI